MTDQNLMLAVLSMHAYSDPVSATTSIGNANFLRAADEANGFAGYAYSYNGETIISYRGTDDGSDAWYGWGGSVGAQTTQAELAAAFYRQVAGGDSGFPFSTNVTFTGHSLGGGLAGLLAGLYGAKAVVFDEMAYEHAALSTYGDALYDSNLSFEVYGGATPIAPNFGEITGWQLDGQILQQLNQSSGTRIGTDVNWNLGSIDLHSQALLVLTMFAEQSGSLDSAWKDVAQYIGPLLFALPGEVLTKIAYSVVSEGVRPNGDAAAHSLFDDAADIAHFLNSDGAASYYIDWPTGLAEIAVQFAARQANNAVRVSSMGDESSGVFHWADDGLFLSVDATTNAWGAGGGGSKLQTLRTGLIAQLTAENGKEPSADVKTILNAVDFVLLANAGPVSLLLNTDNPMVAAGQIADVQSAAGLVFGTDEVDNIIGGKGGDLLLGGAENDVLVGGDGVDALFGGEGADILITGNLNGVNPVPQPDKKEVVSGGAGTDYIVLSIPELTEGAAQPTRIVVQGGDAQDRLLVHRHLIDPDVSSTAETQPLFALLGGVAGTPRSSGPSYSLEDSNLFENNDGEMFRSYGFDNMLFEFSPLFGNGTGTPTFGVGYNHYFESKRLEIEIGLISNGLSAVVVIEDFDIGDYSIMLKGPYELWDEVRSSSELYDDILTFVPLPGIGSYNAAIINLQGESDNYSLDKQGVAIQSRSAFGALGSSEAEIWRIALRGDELANILAGNDVSETINGGAGNDVVRGFGGDDEIAGDEGNDRLIGGEGADQLDGGEGVDTADYRGSGAGVTVDLLVGFGLGGEAEGDVLSGIEYIAGSAFADVLTGDAGVNRIQGMAGDDALFGGEGNDRLLGGAGADHLDGGAGTDTADYSTSKSGVTVNLLQPSLSLGDAAGDSFTSIENISGTSFADSLTGDNGGNRLTSLDGDDTLDGQGGIDYLIGGNGNDFMTGGTHADVFVFNAGFGQDVITDFWVGAGRTDRVQLIGTGVANFAEVLAAMTQTTAGTLFSLNGGIDSILFAGVNVSAFVADDFLFA